jgi:hypothetical protein
VTRSLLEKLSGGRTTDLLKDVLNGDEKSELLKDYLKDLPKEEPSEDFFLKTEPKEEPASYQSQVGSQEIEENIENESAQQLTQKESYNADKNEDPFMKKLNFLPENCHSQKEKDQLTNKLKNKRRNKSSSSSETTNSKKARLDSSSSLGRGKETVKVFLVSDSDSNCPYDFKSSKVSLPHNNECQNENSFHKTNQIQNYQSNQQNTKKVQKEKRAVQGEHLKDKNELPNSKLHLPDGKNNLPVSPESCGHSRDELPNSKELSSDERHKLPDLPDHSSDSDNDSPVSPEQSGQPRYELPDLTDLSSDEGDELPDGSEGANRVRDELPDLTDGYESPCSPSLLSNENYFQAENFFQAKNNFQVKNKMTPGQKVKGGRIVPKNIPEYPESDASTHLEEPDCILIEDDQPLEEQKLDSETPDENVPKKLRKKKSKKELSIQRLVSALREKIPHSHEVQDREFLNKFEFIQTGSTDDENQTCFCGNEVRQIFWIFRIPEFNEELIICQRCVLTIRDAATGEMSQVIDLSRRFHQFGISGIFSGQDSNSTDLKFRIHDLRSKWVQQLIDKPLGLKLINDKIKRQIFLVVGSNKSMI